MANWIFGSYTVPAADSPWHESSMPEEQEDEHIEETPIGANASNATIITYVATPSIGAEGSEPFVLRGHCTAATKADIMAKRKTTFVLKTPFDAVGKSVYLKKARFKRWTTQDPMAIAGSGEQFHYWMYLLGR
jgi:hypothetical protein